MSIAVAAAIAFVLTNFIAILSDPATYAYARTNPGDFTRDYQAKLPLPKLLLYLIFRHEKTTAAEVAGFFGAFGMNRSQPSRQAVFQRLRQLNTRVWPFLAEKFANLFYGASCLVHKVKGYVVFAADSSCVEMPPSEEATKRFGVHGNNHTKKQKKNGKVLARCGGLYDVLNRFFIAFPLVTYGTSEMAIIISQLRNLPAKLAACSKKILLADRGYISLKLMALCQMLGIKFCIRAKTNTYKDLVRKMKSCDENIVIKITKAVLARIKDPEIEAYLQSLGEFQVRVVKQTWVDSKGRQQTGIFFTNLSPEEFSTKEIVELYSLRWRIEVAYKTLKVVCELERYVSLDPDVAINLFYGKVFYFNFCALFLSPLEDAIDQKAENKHKYQINVTVLMQQLHAENFLSALVAEDSQERITEIADDLSALINKMKVAIRPGRSYERWGKTVTCSFKYRFRTDGRQNPRVAMANGKLITVRP